VKGPPVPIGQEAGWAPEPVWTQRIEEKSFKIFKYNVTIFMNKLSYNKVSWES